VAKKAKLEEVLALVPMFRGLSKKQLRQVAALCDVGDFMSDHSIVRQGDRGDAFYVMLTGQAKVTAGRKFLGRLLPGDHFGEIAVLDGGPRTATVTSETPVTLLILKRKDFLTALKADPQLGLALMTEIAHMFRRVSASQTH